MKNTLKTFAILTVSAFFASCGGNNEPKTENTTPTEETTPEEPAQADASADFMSDKGIGPITSVTLDAEINADMAVKGKEIFEAKCNACHKADKKFVGPNPTGVTERRSPEWIMNMILNPEEMLAKNPTAMALLQEYNNAPMANQHLTEDEARSVLEYFRTLN